MAFGKETPPTFTGASSPAASPTRGVGPDDPGVSGETRLQDATRDTPEWVEEALAWIKKERDRHESRVKSHMECASGWANNGYVSIATNELRAAVYENGVSDGLRDASIRLMEGRLRDE